MNCTRLLRFAQTRAANIYKITSAKCISGHHIKFMETQDRWRERDGLSKDWELIYRAPMDNILKVVTTYITVSTTAVASATAYYAMFIFDPSKWDDPFYLGNDVVVANSTTEGLVYIAAFTIFHIATKIVISKFVVRLYQNGDDYIAFFRGSWYNSLNEHKFNRKEFKKLSPTFVVSWGDARFGMGKKHAILFETYFKTPQYLNYLLGTSVKPTET